MIINTLQGFFGILNNDKLNLKPGLNIIKLNNEGGKTTWANFIRLMFYGIDTSKRDKKNVLADKTKYKPLTDNPMSGIMEIEFNNKNLIIERSSGKAGVFSTFNCFDKETGASIYSQNKFREDVLGIEESEFINCAFIDGCDMAILASDIFEDKILALSSTGDNTMGSINALKKLDRLRLDIKVNSSKGYLPTLLEKLKLVDTQIIEYNNIKNELNKIDILKIKNEIDKQQKNKEELLIQNKKSDDEIALKNLENEISLLKKPIDFDINLIDKYMRANTSFLEKTKEYEKNLELYNNQQKDRLEFNKKLLKKKKIYLSLAITSIVIAIILAIYSQMIVAGLLMFLALFIAFNIPKNNFIEKYEKPDENNLSEASLLEKGIKDKIFNICSEKLDINEAIFELKKLQKYAWEYNIKIKTRNDLALKIKNNNPTINIDEKTDNINIEIRNLTTEYENMFKYKNSLEEKINHLGELSTLILSKTEVENNIKKAENTLKAIELAVNVINSANEELSSKISPKIASLCSEYLARITKEAHNKVILRPSLEMFSYKETGLLDILRMSTGTREQLYLALRLCICKLLIDKNIPIILDDPFMSFDDDRIKNTIELLRDIAKDRQIILFTAKDIGENV